MIEKLDNTFVLLFGEQIASCTFPFKTHQLTARETLQGWTHLQAELEGLGLGTRRLVEGQPVLQTFSLKSSQEGVQQPELSVFNTETPGYNVLLALPLCTREEVRIYKCTSHLPCGLRRCSTVTFQVRCTSGCSSGDAATQRLRSAEVSHLPPSRAAAQELAWRAIHLQDFLNVLSFL